MIHHGAPPGAAGALGSATTQSIPLAATVSAAGGIGASLSRRDDRVLATNQANGAVLFRVSNGSLQNPILLATDGEDSLSGALGDWGAYVLTGTALRFFPRGQTTANSVRPLLVADGSGQRERALESTRIKGEIARRLARHDRTHPPNDPECQVEMRHSRSSGDDSIVCDECP